MKAWAPGIYHALSLKQPWAALVVHGIKTIEVRAWSTPRRGLILIHASQTADDRDLAWSRVPAAIQSDAERRGGILGAVSLTDCIAYRTARAFGTDADRHLNDPRWFREPVLYGFCFEEPQQWPFRPVRGWFRFFPVEVTTSGKVRLPQRPRSRRG